MSGMPFVPCAQTGESPLSLLRRAAIGNGYRSTLSLARSMNPAVDYSDSGLRALPLNPRRYRRVCRVMGIPPRDVEAVLYRRVGRGRADALLWHGLRVAPGDLDFRRSKVCLYCYLEKGYAPSEWDHSAALACAKHRVGLLDACPLCRMPFTWQQAPLSCGCPPARAVQYHLACTPPAASSLRRIIATGDQGALDRLTGARRVITWWATLGLPMADRPSAEILHAVFSGTWPLAEVDYRGKTKLHPRVAIAPLLSLGSPQTTQLIGKLLRRPPALWLADGLDEHTWPAATAMAVLGIGRKPMQQMLRQGLLLQSDRGILVASINRMLLVLSACKPPEIATDPFRVYYARRRHQSIAEWFQKETAQQEDAAADAFAIGTRDTENIAAHNGLTLPEACDRLNVNAESVRMLIKLGYLRAEKRAGGSPTQWQIDRHSLEKFDRCYCFPAALAKQYGLSVTTLSSRLRSAGIRPVSGPGIDGGITYLFQRSDIQSLDIHAIGRAPYRSPAGRKKQIPSYQQPPMLRVTEVAEILEVHRRQVRTLVRQGWLTPVDRQARNLTFYQKDVERLSSQIHRDYHAIEAIAKQLGQSPAQFRRTWIDTEFVTARCFSNQLLISESGRQAILALWQKAATAAIIAKALGRERHLCANLLKKNLLQPYRTLGTGYKKVYLYRRDEPIFDRYKLMMPA